MAAEFQSMSYGVKYLVEIENFTNQPLHLVNFEIHSGHVQCPPSNIIMAGHKESYNGCKISYAPTAFISFQFGYIFMH
jgi:hypothetical protein